MKKSKLFIATLSVTIAIVGLCTALPPQSRTQPASASQTAIFDHSQCQYPYRTTNPVDGCDNSDPCDPQDAAKGGSGACVDIQQPKVNENPQTVDIEQPKSLTNTCEGK